MAWEGGMALLGNFRSWTGLLMSMGLVFCAHANEEISMPTRMTRSPSPLEATQTAATHQGLSAAEAARRLAADGPNMLPGSAPKSSWAIVRDVLTEPMFLMLLAAGGIYLALGDRAEAIFLLGFVFVNSDREGRSDPVVIRA